jgi:hypothetical protein
MAMRGWSRLGVTTVKLVKVPGNEVGNKLQVPKSWWDEFTPSIQEASEPSADAEAQGEHVSSGHQPGRGRGSRAKVLCVVIAWDPEYKWASHVQHQGAYMLRMESEPEDEPRPMQPLHYATYKSADASAQSTQVCCVVQRVYIWLDCLD